ncbi:MAG: hypothetical protein COV98_05935 [Candidatus Altarchaeum sp. CG12_big_fil_rev_8_21_14_0_65_33_22]|nr:MAG: hypothetical protein AUK59_01840 [Candidatus Altarchaeum sp. CG2_30_32_3053]PIN66870.1 MAG: hypothetical protein COV98_05935 [Candidatus Altarchaeum sp. CG12_big_fil_rev_8_21_14_0_65_33_22]
MNTNRGLIGCVIGFVVYLLFAFADIEGIKNFLFLLPLFLFLTGISIGYFIKEFKESLLWGGIASVMGVVVFLGLNFGSLNNDLIGTVILNAIGLFFGFGFGAILYYRVVRKRKIKEKISKGR